MPEELEKEGFILCARCCRETDEFKVPSQSLLGIAHLAYPIIR